MKKTTLFQTSGEKWYQVRETIIYLGTTPQEYSIFSRESLETFSNCRGAESVSYRRLLLGKLDTVSLCISDNG